MQCFCPSYIKSRCRRQTLFICWGVTYALPRLSALLAVNSLQPWVVRHIIASSCCYTHHLVFFLAEITGVMPVLSPLCPYASLGASATASAALPVISATNFKLENNRAARLGVGASYVVHSASNSAIALGGKISGSIKRARSQKMEHDDADDSGQQGAADENEDSKCASIKRKHGVASQILFDSGSSTNKKKKKKKKKSTATTSEPLDPVVPKPSLIHEVVPQNSNNSHGKQQRPCSAGAELLIAGNHPQPSQIIVRAEEKSACDSSGNELHVDEDDLGSGLRNYQQGVRKRTKTRSKAKNLKKDKRPPELRPGGEKYAGSSGTWRPPPMAI
jgi:hypothetical protein